MIYRTLGKTGLSVSIIGFGAAPLGNEYGIADADEGVCAVHAALDGGINYFDTAPYYGKTLSETMLGRALKASSLPRDRYILATKVGRYKDAPFDFSASSVVKSVDDSLSRLQTDYVDVIQCHDMEFGNLEQIIHETVPALRKTVESGKARFVGITGLPLKTLQTVYRAVPVDTVLSYCHYTLADTSFATLFDELEAANIGIINAAPLSMRLLTEQGAPEWHPAPPELAAAAKAAADYCREKGVDIADLALRFSLNEPRIHTHLIGLGDTETVAKNLSAVGNPPDNELLKAILEILAPVHNRTWQSGLPENN